MGSVLNFMKNVGNFATRAFATVQKFGGSGSLSNVQKVSEATLKSLHALPI